MGRPARQAERDRVGPSPENAGEQPVIGLTHERPKAIWLNTAEYRHGKPWHNDRLGMLLSLNPIWPPAECLDPECAAGIIV